MQAKFVQAVETLANPACTNDERKAVESWLLEFQQRDDCVGVAMELVASPGQRPDVQTLAAQALKTKARLCRSRSRDVLSQLQAGLVDVLHKNPGLPTQPLRQVILALVAALTPCLDAFGSVLDQFTRHQSASTTVLLLETLAEEVQALMPFGTGTADERAQAVTDIKAALRAQAPLAFTWMAQQATQQLNAASNAASNTAKQQAVESQLDAKLLECFQSWVRLGSLHEISAADSQSLVSFALRHLDDPQSAAFHVSGEVLSELMDYCPQEWLPRLHEPMMRAAQLARQAADVGAATATETLCKVVSAYAAVCINIFEPSASPESAATKDVLLALSLLPLVATQQDGDEEEDRDPVCASALTTWTFLAEYLTEERVGGYDVFDEEEYFREEDKGASRNGDHAAHDGQDAEEEGRQHWQATGQFQNAGQVLQAQGAAAERIGTEAKAVYERLLCGLLNNLIAWQEPERISQQAPITRFTPSFTSTLNDCLASCCSVLGPQRFTSLLWMLVDRPASDPMAPAAAAAALTAVSAAGSLRMTSQQDSLQTVAGIMQKAGTLPCPANSASTLLVTFCCAAAACCRPCVKALSQAGQDAPAFIMSTLQKALQGLSLPEEDNLDVRTPAAFAVKQLMTGACEAGIALPTSVLQTLQGSLQGVTSRDAAAEQALVTALTTCCSCLQGGHTAQQRAICEVYQSLAAQVQTLAQGVVQQLQSGKSWEQLQDSVDELLAGQLRRYSLLLQHELQASSQASGGSPPADAHSSPNGSRPTVVSEGCRVLCRTFLDGVWPSLHALITWQKETVDGLCLNPACRCLALIIKAQAAGVEDKLQTILETLAGMLFRPHGRHAAEPFCSALLAYGAHEQASRLAHHAVSAVLGTARSAVCRELRGADKDPELAEALLKVAAAYMKRTFGVLARHDPQQAQSALDGVCMLAAACCCANHRGVCHAALACVGGMLDASAEVSGQVLAMLRQQGVLITTGLLGGLLTLSPLPRVPKVQSLMIQMYTQLLSQGDSNCGGKQCGQCAACQQQQRNGSTGPGQPGSPYQGNNGAAAPGAAGAATFAGWLDTAAAQFQLSGEERQSLVHSWPGALAEAAHASHAVAVAGQQQSPEAAHALRQQQAALKRLKKLLRDFAELHSRTQ